MVFVCSVFITLSWAFHIMKIFIMLFYKVVIHMIVDKMWTPRISTLSSYETSDD